MFSGGNQERARWGDLLILAGAFGLTLVGVALRWFPLGVLVMLGSLSVTFYTTRMLFRHYTDRSLQGGC